MRVRGQQKLSRRHSGRRQREHVRIFNMPFFLLLRATPQVWGFVCLLFSSLVTFSSFFITDFSAFFLVCFPEAAPGQDRQVATQRLVLPAQVKSLELQPGRWELCHLWMTGSKPELWLGVLCADSGIGCWLLYCQKSGFVLLGTRCLQLMSQQLTRF